ncbi:ferric reduction oxidase 2 [Selaginella moellendorffii]|nr:ferric reduction oxidase 2 [Selaginella moellendorffii]XP_024536689.1 ferric reduction oxidase 2 [Selaginella moellendorffii]XP_024536690.1 ferric reduction oxidase 2 [Selaginella moellendorffii]|eukprot:XP_002975964.2 ferric reduction oxidase 2 [Selaginella moellendorffii]
MAALSRVVWRLLMLLLFGGWILMWVMRPTSAYSKFWQSFTKDTTTKAYGVAGSFTLFYSAPVVILAVVGAIYLQLSKDDSTRRRDGVRVNPFSFPAVVRGPLAVASAAELTCLVLFVALLVWTLSEYLSTKFAKITPAYLHKHQLKLWERKLEMVGTNLGLVGIVCLAFLFFPVARGSVFLRLLNVPFEHAIKYHIWIGHIMMVIWTVHGLVFVIFWAVTGKMTELVQWKKTEISGLSGLFVYIIGVIMWMTSLGPVRKKKFELFYYTHQLYIVFILTFALHVGDRLFCAVVGGILLFLLNRFLRFIQSRRIVDVLSARMMSSETMELTIAKHPSLAYNPASFIMVNFPVVSPLQWHPFTIVSSSKVDTEHLSLLIKCYGGWTLTLKEYLKNADTSHIVEAAVEGPYGHDMSYVARYDVLIFVAGGSGISPFISIIKELLYDIENQKVLAPEEIILLWAVKKSDDLSVLQLITPDFASRFKIDVQVYVTREDGPELEKPQTTASTIIFSTRKSQPRSISGSEGIQNGILHAALVLASSAGFLFVIGILERFVVYPVDHNTSDLFSRSLGGLFGYIATVIGVVVFGGGTLALWNRLARRDKGVNKKPERMLSTISSQPTHPSQVHYGSRPHLPDVFHAYAKRLQGSKVGVFACGPVEMQRTVATQCQAPRFSYHPLNYDL